MDTHVTVAEAARLLGIQESGLRKRLRRGDLHGEHVGARLWLIPRAEIKRARDLGRLKPGRKSRDRT